MERRHKNKLLVLQGLPASGKSTYALNLTKQGWVRTNKDEIRQMLFGGTYKHKNEKQVVRLRDFIVSDNLAKGKNVVVDDTNLNPVHIKDLQQLAKKYNAEFEVNASFLAVPIEECIKRDLNRPKSVGESVIRGMYAKWLFKPASLSYDPNLPMAVIVDIDGTLAHMEDRDPFEWHKVGSDSVDLAVAHLVDALGCINYATVFLFSGRDEVCRPETEDWLARHDIEYFKLVMRPEKDTRKDTEVKREMLEAEIIGKYNVLFIVDDRPSVCRAWREQGYKVLQAGDPYLEF